MILHFGVIDIPYTEPTVRVHRFGLVRLPGVTTGDVAEFLEDKYHVMRNFFEIHKDDIGSDLADAMSGSLENLLAGSPLSNVPYAEGLSKIEDRFKQFLATGEMERIGYPGVPTKAAIRRRSLRFKEKRGPAQRPSFIDTGNYQSSFKAWID